MTNPNRLLIDDNCLKIPLQPLFVNVVSGMTRETDFGSIGGEGSNALRVRCWAGEWGGWIEVEGYAGRWGVMRQPHPEYDWLDDFFYVVGTDGKKHKHLLVIVKAGKIHKVGTRTSLGCHFPSQHQSSTKRRIKARHVILNQLGILGHDPADLTIAYVPIDGGGFVGGLEEKPKLQKWTTYWKRWRRANPHHLPIIVPVHKPIGIITPVFNRHLNFLNKSLIKSGKIKPLLYTKVRRCYAHPKWTIGFNGSGERRRQSVGRGRYCVGEFRYDDDGISTIKWMNSVFGKNR